MKKIILGLLLSFNAIAEEVPEYMKGAIITVKTRDGKEYTFKGEEYKVVKRGQSVKPLLITADAPVVIRQEAAKVRRSILSLEVVSSYKDLDVDSNGNVVDVNMSRKIGIGIQYQYNLFDDLFIGGRIDSNGGQAINVGLGF